MRYNIKKTIFLVILGIIILAASFFMITESARYYRIFYEPGAWQPLYLAGLLELFVLVLATIKIGSNKFFNIIQKLIMAGVFGVIIFAAGIQAVNPTLESVAMIEQKEALTDILKQEYENLQKDREVFERQKQKRNTAIASAERRKIVEDFKNLFNQDVTTNKGRVALINILLLFCIRFLVQLSNVFCASMLGFYFRIREKDTKKKTSKQLVLEIHPEAVCKFKKGAASFLIFKNKTVENSKNTLGKGLTAGKAWESAYLNMKG
jgi:hypothetical protein